MINTKKTDPRLLRALKDNPFNLFDTLIMLSSESKQPFNQDFVMVGDAEVIAKHLAIMMNRHPDFKQVIHAALFIESAAEDLLNKFKDG